MKLTNKKNLAEAIKKRKAQLAAKAKPSDTQKGAKEGERK